MCRACLAGDQHLFKVSMAFLYTPNSCSEYRQLRTKTIQWYFAVWIKFWQGILFCCSQMLLVVKSRKLKKLWMTHLQAQNPHLVMPSSGRSRRSSSIKGLPVRLVEERYSLTGNEYFGLRRPSLRRTISFWLKGRTHSVFCIMYHTFVVCN